MLVALEKGVMECYSNNKITAESFKSRHGKYPPGWPPKAPEPEPEVDAEPEAKEPEPTAVKADPAEHIRQAISEGVKAAKADKKRCEEAGIPRSRSTKGHAVKETFKGAFASAAYTKQYPYQSNR